MNRRFKYRSLSIAMFFVLFILIRLLVDDLFENWDGIYKAMLTGGLTAILSPRISENKQAQYQLEWIFLKKPIPVSF